MLHSEAETLSAPTQSITQMFVAQFKLLLEILILSMFVKSSSCWDTANLSSWLLPCQRSRPQRLVSELMPSVKVCKHQIEDQYSSLLCWIPSIIRLCIFISSHSKNGALFFTAFTLSRDYLSRFYEYLL